MVLDLFRCFIESVLDPLVDDAEIPVGKEGHQVGQVPIIGFPVRAKDLKGFRLTTA